jgi:hypothetical protein
MRCAAVSCYSAARHKTTSAGGAGRFHSSTADAPRKARRHPCCPCLQPAAQRAHLHTPALMSAHQVKRLCVVGGDDAAALVRSVQRLRQQPGRQLQAARMPLPPPDRGPHRRLLHLLRPGARVGAQQRRARHRASQSSARCQRCTVLARPAGEPQARPHGHSSPRARAFPDSSRCCCCRTVRPARPPPSRPPSRLSSPSGARIRGPVVSVAAHGGAGPRRCRRHGLRAQLPGVGAGRGSALIPAPRFHSGPARTRPQAHHRPDNLSERARLCTHRSALGLCVPSALPAPRQPGRARKAGPEVRSARRIISRHTGRSPLSPAPYPRAQLTVCKPASCKMGCSVSSGAAASARLRAPPLGSTALAQHAALALQVRCTHAAPHREMLQPYCPGSKLTASPSTIPPPQRPAAGQPRPAPASR